MLRLLEKIGFHCTICSSGEKAIEIMRKAEPGAFHAVLLDVWMPGVGGLAAAKEIKTLTSHWDKPPLLVACSADTSAEIPKESHEKGIRYFLPKPLDRQRLEVFQTHLLQFQSPQTSE